MEFVKKEIGEKVSPEIVGKYLNIPQIGIGEIKEVYAEIVRIDSKFTVNKNPYISLKLKDINGRIVSASMFDATFDTQTLEVIGKLKKVYCQLKYEAICLGSNVHLQVKNIVILDSSEITNELVLAFTPEFKDTQVYLDKIRNHSFGEYQGIFKLLLQVDILKSVAGISFEEFGNAKIGAMSQVIANVLDRIENSELSTKYLSKITALYSIVYYCNSKQLCTLGTTNNVVSALRNLGSQLDVFKTSLPGELTARFCEEVERVICDLYEVPVVASTTSEAIRLILKSEKEISDLVNISYSAPKGYILNHKGKKLVNR